MTRQVVLVVLDGWGYRAEREGNAVALAETPTWDALWGTRPRTLLEASGLAVGLPEGQMGNSEVGHLNMGAGRVVNQDIVRISKTIESGEFFRNPVILDVCRHVRKHGGTLHLVGLIGDGGVHALDQHLFALIDLAEREHVPRTAVHALLDGRDTMPKSGLAFMEQLLARARGRAIVASLGGRYYGMDRDKRWERTERFYLAAVHGEGPRADDPLTAIRQAYQRGETDEFIMPTVIVEGDTPRAPMADQDGVIFFNFRADRMRQLVRALTDENFDGFSDPRRPHLRAATMTVYDRTLDIPAAFPARTLARIVAEVISERGMRMFRTAETEKYAHVTYFFNGGIEQPFPGEERILVPSQKVATYDLMPEMSAPGVTEVLCSAIEAGNHEFILCNYANGDMVGHSGSLPATIAAVQTVDECLGRMLAVAERKDARVLVTADHGNCELMIDPETGGPHTAHTTSPVPFVMVDPEGDRPLREGGALCDVGPTILSMLGVEQPPEMTGTNLRLTGDRS
ncbi:MAG TPA: 2,3-bisphosphoglycerate-independent phosphoglycerate mutase [Gemmatimonadaceae bacterium]|nr:2,3-bisphosphoglycerate-independent phosphoglycerate mutase [Gemmatimonadaceae bacterium]